MIKFQKPPDPKQRTGQVLRAEKKSRKLDKRLVPDKPMPRRQGKGKH